MFRNAMTKKQKLSMSLAALMLLSTLPGEALATEQSTNALPTPLPVHGAARLDGTVPGGSSNGTGVRTHKDPFQNLFLGNDYIEIGIAPSGSFGTTAEAPLMGSVLFHPDDYMNRLGLRSDGDGWETGNPPTTRDFFLPGTIDEGFMVGWSSSKTEPVELKASVSEIGWTGVSGYEVVSVTDKSTETTLQGENAGIIRGALAYTQNISFEKGDKRFTTVITLKNTTTQPLYNASYIRKFDPDQSPTSHETDNYFFRDGAGGVWAVASSSSLGGDGTVSPEAHKALLAKVENPFIFYTNDHRAQVISCAVGTGDYEDIYARGEALYGTHQYSDTGMGLEFLFPVINPGESVTFSYESSLDPDIRSAQEAIENLAVFISRQPVSRTYVEGQVEGRLIVQGHSVAEGVDHGDALLTYQWYRNTENSTLGGVAIEGATSNIFDLPASLPEGSVTYYYCKVTATKDGLAVSKDSGMARITVVTKETAIHEVRFEENTSHLVLNMPAHQTLKEGDSIAAPLDPSSAGLEFTGWYTQAEGGEKWDFRTSVAEDTVLYAQWIPEDTTRPEITDLHGNPLTWTKENASITFQATDNRGVAEVTVSRNGIEETLESTSSLYGFTVSENGTYLITVTDLKGNVETVSVEVTKIDKTLPVIDRIDKTPTTWTQGPVLIGVSAQDGESGLHSAAYSFDGGTTWQEDPAYLVTENETLLVRVRDAAGNLSKSTAVQVDSIDLKAPVILEVKGNLTEWTRGEVQLDIVAEDAGSGLSLMAFSFDDGMTWQEESTKAFSENGTLFLRVRDEVGNISERTTIQIANIDKTAPTGSITLEVSPWRRLLNRLTFHLFFKDHLEVTVLSSDEESGVDTVSIYKAPSELTEEELSTISWRGYSSPVFEKAVDGDSFVYYAKITDQAGNITLLQSTPVIFDTTAPVISGITDGKTYYVSQKLTVHDTNLDTVLVNGLPVTEETVLEGNQKAVYEIEASDLAGNSVLCTITMKPLGDLTSTVDALTVDTVQSGDEAVIENLLSVLSDLDLTHAGMEEKEEVQEKIDYCKTLLAAIEKMKAENTLPETGTARSAPLWAGFFAAVLGGVLLMHISEDEKKAKR